MEQKLIEIIHDLILKTESLTDHKFENPDAFQLVLQASFRSDMMVAKAIYYLLIAKPENPSLYAVDGVALLRKIIENYINIRYMIFKGRDKYAKRFQTFYAVDKMKEYELAKDLAETEEEKTTIKTYFAPIIEDYNSLRSDIKDDKTWAGIQFEEMLRLLNEASELDIDSRLSLNATYNLCCQNLHFSVIGLAHYSDINTTTKYFYFNLKILLRVFIDIYSELAFLLAKEIDPEHPLIKVVTDLKAKARDIKDA